MKRCATSGKRKYHTKLEALLRNQNRPVIARAYRCRDCRFWHLTRANPLDGTGRDAA